MGSCVSSASYSLASSARANAVTTAARIKQAAAAVEFALAAADTVSNMKKLSAISSRGISIEEQEQQRLKEVYWPSEDKFFDEFKNPTPWESQAVLAKRYAGQMWASIAGGFAQKLKQLEINKVRYSGVAHVRAFQELLIARALAKANVTTLADRIAFAEVEAFKDRDFDRRKAAIAMRQGLIGQAAALMSAAANGLASAGQDSFRQANSALGLIGYEQERIRTQSGGDRFHAQSARMAESMVQRDDAGGDSFDKGTFESDTTSYAEDANFADMGSMQTYTGADYNQTTDDTTAMQGRDLARGGSITIQSYKIPVEGISGGMVTIPNTTLNLDSADLVSVDEYATDMVQTSPKALPSAPEGAQPIVTYKPA